MLKHQEQTEVLTGLLSQTALAGWRSLSGSWLLRQRTLPGRAWGRSCFHIAETATGKVRGFRRNHDEACAYAEQLKRQQAAK